MEWYVNNLNKFRIASQKVKPEEQREILSGGRLCHCVVANLYGTRTTAR